MPDVRVTFNDNTVRNFLEADRTTGVRAIRVRFEGGFAIITDDQGRLIAFPSQNIKQVQQEAE